MEPYLGLKWGSHLHHELGALFLKTLCVLFREVMGAQQEFLAGLLSEMSHLGLNCKFLTVTKGHRVLFSEKQAEVSLWVCNCTIL